jgi:hypothetical protein
MANESLFVSETAGGLGSFTVAQKQEFWNMVKQIGWSGVEQSILQDTRNALARLQEQESKIKYASYGGHIQNVWLDRRACSGLLLGGSLLEIAGGAILIVTGGAAFVLTATLGILGGVMGAFAAIAC